VIQIRKEVLKAALLNFNPDLFLVDNFPLGANGELLESLQMLKDNGCKSILGLRDILDAPEVVKKEWKKKKIYEVLKNFYEKIFIYGMQEIFDAIELYEMDQELAKKTTFTGFLTHISDVKSKQELGVNGKLVLANGGGGGDAFPLFDTLIKIIPHFKEITFLLIFGPLMGKEDKETLQKRGKGLQNLQFLNYLPNLSSYFKSADALITMCGYNSAAEIVSTSAKALVIPRTWRFGEHQKKGETSEEKEQILRAESLANGGYIELLYHKNLNEFSLKQALEKVLSKKFKPKEKLALDGLHQTVTKLKEFL
jgi:predicted glycosyltransferase